LCSNNARSSWIVCASSGSGHPPDPKQTAPALFVEYRWGAILIMLTSILAAAGHDLYRRRAVHPVYLIGIVLFLLRLLRLPLAQSEAWRAIGREMLRPFL
jgi:4-hydroxybenzoate polyprenyltransferase